MSAVDYAIDIVSLSKRFKRQTLSRAGYTTLKSSALSWVSNCFGLLSLFKKGQACAPQAIYTTAIKELTMRVPQGASIGIIGQNGSGKSTLLKLITGIYKPDTGRVSVNGRVAALIELGAGFHPDFTGRENLYLGGVMHGLSRAEIDARFEQIVKFAELEAVIDDPVRTYSSGMFMRLGFSLAVHTEPDVLIIDEVLAVGDAAFVAKCKERISKMRRDGITLLLVSHDLAAVERWCDEALWLHQGEVKDRGNPRRVIDHYREFVERGEETELRDEAQQLDASRQTQASADKGAVKEQTQESSSQGTAANALAAQQSERWGSREIEIKSVSLSDGKGQSHFLFHSEDKLAIEIEYQVNESALVGRDDIVFGICFRRSDGLIVHGSNTDIEKIVVPPPAKNGRVFYEVSRLGLLDGNYALDVAVHKKDGYPYDYQQGLLTFAVRSPFQQIGVCALPHQWRFES